MSALMTSVIVPLQSAKALLGINADVADLVNEYGDEVTDLTNSVVGGGSDIAGEWVGGACERAS